jgi:hypothetical protein
MISRATQTDSAAMKTVAVLTMTFLPATFISVSYSPFTKHLEWAFLQAILRLTFSQKAVFSMSFFNFRPATGDQPQAWSVSDKLWIYWMFAIPLTAITVLVWFWWQRATITRAAGDR